MGIEIAAELPPAPGAVAEARQVVDELAPALDHLELRDVRLLVSELVTNGLRHGGGARCEPVDLRVRLGDGVVRVEVADRGHGFGLPLGGPRARGESGWGLVLVDSLSNRWGVHRDGRTVVWFELDVQHDADAGRPGPDPAARRSLFASSATV